MASSEMVSSGSKAPQEFPGNEYLRLCAELSSYGLTVNQARTYVYLLASPHSTARVISKALGLHRVDVYRKLHELENFGIIETAFGIPRTYSAIPSKRALTELLQRQEEKVNHLRFTAADLTLKLDRLVKSVQTASAENYDYDSSYRIIIGRDNFYAEMRDQIRSAHTEVLRVTSPTGLKTAFLTGIFEECTEAAKRGVSIRTLLRVDRNNRYAKRLSRVVQLRYLRDDHPRFSVIDRSVLMTKISGYRVESVRSYASEDKYLVIKDPKVAGAFCLLFDLLWKQARGASG